MPNNITNCITLSGTKDAVRHFRKTCFQEDNKTLDFEKIIPPPENMYRGNLEKKVLQECIDAGIPDWLSWQSSNWGTSKNAFNGWIETENETIINFAFNTSWNHPEPIFEKLVELGFEIGVLWQVENDYPIKIWGNGKCRWYTETKFKVI